MIDTTMYEQAEDYPCYNEDNYSFNMTNGSGSDDSSDRSDGGGSL